MSDTDLAFRATLDGSGFASGAQAINGHLRDMGIQTGTATSNLGGLGTLLGTMANPMTAVVLAATAVGAALAASVSMAASWESAMAGVSKTTTLTGADLQGLSKELLDMSTRLPTAASDLANIAQVAGSLGVVKENIAGFTEVAAQMAVGFEMSADVAATSAAKILTAYGKDIDASNMKALGNAVNALGDSTAATEPQIMDFVNRASFLGSTFGQSIPQIAALGATLISTGMEAETASTGIKSLLNIGLSESANGKGLNAISELMGTSNEAMKQAFGEDIQGTLTQVADKLMTIEDPVKRFNTAVAIAGTEGATALTKLAGQATNLKTNLTSANSEWTNGTSLMKTYGAQSATLDSQMQIFWNTVNKAGVELGTVLLPGITATIQALTGLTKEAIGAGEAIYGGFQAIDSTIGGWAKWLDKDIFGIGDNVDLDAAMAQDKMAESLNESLSGDAAKTVAQDAGKEIGEDFSKAIATAISYEAAGVTVAEVAMYEQGLNALKAAGLNQPLVTGEGSSKWQTEAFQAKTTIASSEITSEFTPDKKGGTYKIKQDGNVLAEKRYIVSAMPNRDDAITDLLKTSELFAGATQGNIFELANMPAEALAWNVNVDIKPQYSVDAGPSWDQIINPQNKAEYEMKSLGEKMGSAVTDGVATEAEKKELFGLADSLSKVRAESPTIWKTIGGESSNAMIDAILAGDWAKLDRLASQVGQDFKKNLLGGTALDAKSLTELIADPASLKAAAIDQDRFWKGTMLPTIKNNADDAKRAFDSGQFTQQQIYDNYIKPMSVLTKYMPGWVDDINQMFKVGEIDIDGYKYLLDGMTKAASDASEKTAKDLKNQSVGYDNLKKTISDCADDAMSDFGSWQEAQTNLFQGSYIGQGGQAYLDWKTQQVSAIAETQAAMRAAGGAVMGQDYTQSALAETQIKIGADTSAADDAKQMLIDSVISSKPEMTLQIETTEALSEVERLINQIVLANPVMSVQIQLSAYAGEIAAMVEDAVRGALA